MDSLRMALEYKVDSDGYADSISEGEYLDEYSNSTEKSEDSNNQTVHGNVTTEDIDSKPLSNLCPEIANAVDDGVTSAATMFTTFDLYDHLPLQEVCVTFKPKYCLNKSNLTIYREFKDFIINYCRKFDYFKPMMVWVPEYTQNGVIHFHGIVYFDNSNYYWTADLKRKLSSKFGRTKGKDVYDYKVYRSYMWKTYMNNKGLKEIQKDEFFNCKSFISPFRYIHQ